MDTIMSQKASYNTISPLMTGYNTDNLQPIKEDNPSPESVQKAASEFEAHFIYFMLQTMRKTIPKTDFLHTMKGEDTYYSIYDREIAREVSKQHGIGLTELLVEELGSQEKKSSSDAL